MRAEKARWSRRYQTALRKHVKLGAGVSLRPADGLGRQAVALGLQTLDVAKCHEQALPTVVTPGVSSKAGQRRSKSAKQFFAEVIAPIEQTHRAAVNAGIRVNQLTRTLRRRTAESSRSACRLARGIRQRQRAEKLLKESWRRHTTLLGEARVQQTRLRHLTRDILSAQESERTKNSSQIHDEIAQTLIAIDLRLLALKNVAKTSTANLRKEIASTQRLVRKSKTRLSRFLRL